MMAARLSTCRRSLGLPSLHPSREGEGHRDTDDPQEEGEDEIREGPSMPGGMTELRIDREPCSVLLTRIMPAIRRAPEGVKRDQPLLRM